MENHNQDEAKHKHEHAETQPKKSGKGLTFALVIVIILAIVAVFGTWYYMNNKAKNDKKTQDAQINQLKQQILELQKQESSAQQTGKTSTTYVKIPELSLQYPINNDTSGLKYYVNCSSSVCSLKLSTADLESKAKQLDPNSECEAKSGPLGGISRGKKGDIILADKPIELIDGSRQIGNYYYIYSTPQATCSNIASVQQLQTESIKQAKALIGYLEPMQ
jgi:type II secretory pathway pseudopilin PulG